MKIMFAMSLFAGLLMAGMANAATVWNPLANPDQTGPFNWNEPANWTKGVPTTNPDPDVVDPPSSGKAVFNVFDVAETQVTDAQEVWKIVQGDGGSGGVLRVMNGGSLTTAATWSAVGYNDEAHLIIETGGAATFGEHLWVGFQDHVWETPMVDVDGGTLTVTKVLGLNWSSTNGGIDPGSDSIVNVTNNGVVNVLDRLDLGNKSGLGTLNINSGGVVNANRMKNDGTIIIGDGGQLITPDNNWVAVGQRDTGASAVLTVETGGLASFGQHLWVGWENANAVGIVNLDGGTVSVGGMLGLGWTGAGTGTVNVNNGGHLELAQLHADGESSIESGSGLYINGTGKLTIPGDRTETLTSYIENGRIYSNGVTGNVNLFDIAVDSAGNANGDYNDDGSVDAADYTVWRDNLGTNAALPNDSIGGTIGTAQYDLWRANYGASSSFLTTLTAVLPAAPLAASAAPEPSAMLLASLLGLALPGLAGRRRG
jgi:hypothetical protein